MKGAGIACREAAACVRSCEARQDILEAHV